MKCKSCKKPTSHSKATRCRPCYLILAAKNAHKYKAKCKNCKKPVPDRRAKWCRTCYLAQMFPRLKVRDDLSAYAGMLQKDVAAVIGVSYVQFRRYIKETGLRTLFPAHGGASAQIAQRGYAE